MSTRAEINGEAIFWLSDSCTYVVVRRTFIVNLGGRRRNAGITVRKREFYIGDGGIGNDVTLY